MANILDRIEKLVALALNNPNEEEARSAALKALQMMREHKATITMPRPQPAYLPFPDQQQPPPFPFAPFTSAAPSPVDAQATYDFFRTMFNERYSQWK